MTNLHKIRARIRSVNSTQQITRTMKMIAVSKLRKTQTSLAGVRLFADKGQEVLNALLAGVHLDGVVDLRQLSGRELHVHHRADDPFDDTVFHTFSLRGTRRCRRGVSQILVIA